MKPDESQLSSAGVRRAPSWEKHVRNPYIRVLIIALLLSAVCLYLWSQERAEARLHFKELFTERAEIELPPAAEGFASAFRLYSEKWQFFIEEIELAALHGERRDFLTSLPATLFTDESMLDVWICLEPDEARSQPPFAIFSDRHSSETGDEFAQSAIEGEYYAVARKRMALRLRPVVRSEIDFSSLLGSFYSTNSGMKEKITLLVDGPAARHGKFIGIAGFEVDLPGIREKFLSSSYLSGMDMLLIDPDGEITVSSRGSFAGEHYRKIGQAGYADALTACVSGAMDGEQFNAFLSGSGSSLTFAAFVPVSAGDDSSPWILVALNDMHSARVAGKGYLLALFLIWFAALCAILAMLEVKKRRVSRDENERAFAAMQPEAAAFFKKHEPIRKSCYVLCAFFFIIAMFVLQIYEKRYRAALQASDIEAAAKELSAMKWVTLAGVLIGCVIIYLNIIYR